ncbi:Nramp family divalent metal transporter [Streptomyces sp. NPDC048383]|uniref:Nramp family divalent metal transporter n=1 Tax=Streptomyces sp. NPDC048383 TaxID=3155386 RepID=UPI0034313B5D
MNAAARSPASPRAAHPHTAHARPARRAVLLGPAFVAAIAYVDPGNFAPNFAAGSSLGNQLLRVVAGASALAVLVQFLSAKLRLATGRDLASLCRGRYPRPVVAGLWVTAELVLLATDLAEVVGGVIGLELLFGTPPLPAALITCAVSFALLALHSRGVRTFTRAITGLLAVITLGFLFNIVRAGVDPGAVAGGLVPGHPGPDGVLLALGILGATVMPHAIFLHSALAAANRSGDPRAALTRTRREILVALGLAGLVNAAMVVLAARVFHNDALSGSQGVATLEEIHAGLAPRLGEAASLAFALALLASGFASSAVGTLAGQIVMEGFLRCGIPLLARRTATMAPALAVVALGVSTTSALVWSQVLLTLGLPFVLVPLIALTRDRSLMGPLANRPATTTCAALAAALVVLLNLMLLSL